MSDVIDGLRVTAAASLFPTEGTVQLEGLEASVDVRRDTWGVAYLRADSLDDLWFAQGVVTAGERCFQLDLILRAANGRLSEVFADRTLDDDRFARTIGFRRAGQKMLGTWDDADRHMHERFRAGVAAWIQAMPAAPVEYTLLDLQPDLPTDDASWAAAFSFLAWALSGNWDAELLRTWIRERAGDEAATVLFPPLTNDPPVVHAGALRGSVFDTIPRIPGQGSNDWVVAGSRTASGKPLLANDPHLLATQPGAWLELHLEAPGYRARGVALTFSPGILLGTTAHHAWGVTNVSGDTQDLYVETLDPDRTASRFQGAWEPLTVHRETIDVRGSEPQVLEVRESRHGPLLEVFTSGLTDVDFVDLPSEPVYALRWIGSDGHGIRPSLVLDAARASSFDAFRDAIQDLACPGQNFVYADVDGTIGYASSGRFPIRERGDGTVPVPGDTGTHEWIGTIPTDELPWAADPARGFLVTANNRVHADDYPHLIGRDFHPPYRARRIVEVLMASDRHDVAAMAALQTDTVSLPARETLPLLLRVEPAQEDQQRALAILRDWDGDMGAGSSGAAIYNVWSRQIARALLEPMLGEDLFRRYHAWRETFQCSVLPALLRGDPPGWVNDDLLRETLTEALAELEETLGEEPAAWRWGALHHVRLAHPLASIPGLDALFLAADSELGGDEQTVLQSGFDGRDGYQAAVIPSWRAVYDLADLDASVGVLPAGNSGNPASAHWNDQHPLWLRGETHPLPFSAEAVDRATVSRLTLVPGYHR